MNTRRKPDLEAVTVKVRADKITDRGYFHARKTHGGNRMAAEGGVEVTVVKQHKGSGKSNKRPAPGTVFFRPGRRRTRGDRSPRNHRTQKQRQGRKADR